MKVIILCMSLVGASYPVGWPALSAPPMTASSGEEDFTFIKAQGEVRLYERWLEIEPGRKGREMKAEFTVPQGTAAVAALLRDEGKAKDWIQRASACRLVSEANDQSWLAYVHYGLPWPISDQDCLLRYELKQQGGQTRIAFRSVANSSFPPKSRVKRMKGIVGSWLLTPQAGNRTKITYTIMTTETPTLPRWVTDPHVQSNLLDTMNAFFALLKG